MAREVSQVAASQVAIVCGKTVVVSTLNGEQTHAAYAHLTSDAVAAGPTNWKLGKESFVVSSLTLDPDESPR